MNWDFALGNVTSSITDILKGRSEAETAQRVAEAQIAATASQEQRALSLASLNMSQVQFAIVGVVVAIFGVALLRKVK